MVAPIMAEFCTKLRPKEPFHRTASGYNAAQRLYAKRRYILDGRGITYRNCFVEEGASVLLDNDLVMHFTKGLPAG